jgi:hypothetical protein
MNATSFLRCLYGDDPLESLVLWTRQDRQAYWCSARDLEAAGRLAEQLAIHCDVYFGVAPQDKEAAFAKWREDNPHAPGAPTTRGYSETAQTLPGFWADIDVRSPAHKATNLPSTKAAARVFLTEFPLPQRS